MFLSRTPARASLVALATVVAAALATTIPSPAAAQGTGTWYDSLSANPTSLFPLTNSDAISQNMAAMFFESLLDRHWDSYEWMPALASTWEISKDGREFTFTLDPKAKFWDGTPVTADDVKFSFDVIFMDGVMSATNKPYYEKIEKVEILGKDKVRFRVKDVYYKNFDVCAGLTVFPKAHYLKLYAKDKSMTKADVTKDVLGSGMWRIEKWADGQQIILKRNDGYWNRERLVKEGRWNVDRRVYKIITDETVEFETFRKGDLTDISMRPKQWALQSSGPEWGTRIIKVQARNKTAKGYNYVAWNNKHPILGDKNVRWALAHLMDLNKWSKKLEFDLSEPTVGPYSPKMEEHDPSLKAVAFDPKEARKRLAAAGWTKAGADGFLVKDGRKFEITLLYPVQAKETYEPRFTDFKNQAAKVGVNIVLKPMEWTSFTKLLDDRNFDAVALAWTRDIDGDLKQIWHSDSEKDKGSNFVSYKNPEVDALIEKHRATMDRAQRVEVARKLQKLVYEDQPYAFMLENKYSLYAHQNYAKKDRDTFNYSIGQSFWKLAPQ